MNALNFLHNFNHNNNNNNNKSSKIYNQSNITDYLHSAPKDYIQYLEEYDGGEGDVGNNYLILWKTNEIYEYNILYRTEEFAPGYVIIGSDGGDSAYALSPEGLFCRFPFVGMLLEEDPEILGSSFEEFTKFLFEED